ncbi:MAG: roadblock/LC7 domain-containing protein [Promethearchaeota archaeon]
MVNFNENELKKILIKFRENSQIYGSILVNNDGFLITYDHISNSHDEDYYESIAAISAAITSLAEQSIAIIKEKKFFKQIFIQAGSQLDRDSFGLILQYISVNVMLIVIFPIFLNIGVIQFELRKTINELCNILGYKNKKTEESIRILP